MSDRSFRDRWTATPRARPDVLASTDVKTTKVYVSWNGATDLDEWEIIAGAQPSETVVTPLAGLMKLTFQRIAPVPAARA